MNDTGSLAKTDLTTAHPIVLTALADHPLADSVEKTRDMEDIEWDYRNSLGQPKDLRILMLEALANSPTQRAAANSLDLFPPTFSHWLRKLGIIAQARAIRMIVRERKLRKSA